MPGPRHYWISQRPLSPPHTFPFHKPPSPPFTTPHLPHTHLHPYTSQPHSIWQTAEISHEMPHLQHFPQTLKQLSCYFRNSCKRHEHSLQPSLGNEMPNQLIEPKSTMCQDGDKMSRRISVGQRWQNLTYSQERWMRPKCSPTVAGCMFAVTPTTSPQNGWPSCGPYLT